MEVEDQVLALVILRRGWRDWGIELVTLSGGHLSVKWFLVSEMGWVSGLKS